MLWFSHTVHKHELEIQIFHDYLKNVCKLMNMTDRWFKKTVLCLVVFYLTDKSDDPILHHMVVVINDFYVIIGNLDTVCY